MQISTEQLNTFKQTYKQHFGVNLNDKKALELGTILLNHVRTVVHSNKENVGQ